MCHAKMDQHRFPQPRIVAERVAPIPASCWDRLVLGDALTCGAVPGLLKSGGVLRSHGPKFNDLALI